MKVRTKINETDAARVETNLTLDFADVSREEWEALASRTVVIMWQAQCRKAGKIPAGDHTLKVRDMLDRERAPRKPMDLKAALSKLSPEERAELLAQFQQ